MSTLIFFLIVFCVILPRLRDQQRTSSATQAARRAQFEENRRRAQAGQQPLRQDPPAPRYTYPRAAQPQPQPQRQQTPRPAPVRSERTEREKKDLLHLIAGAGFTIAAGCFGVGTIGALSSFLESVFMGYFFSSELAGIAFLGASTFGTGFLARHFFKKRDFSKHYELYKTIIGDRKVCPLADIARASGRSAKKVMQEMLRMVQDGYFPLGFVDVETACFYADNDAWRAANPERAAREDAQLRFSEGAAQPEPAPAPEPDTAADAETANEDALRALRKQVAHVENADIREKAAHLCRHAEDIFAWVKLHPECTDDVRRFCSYYLPTAEKLLATYNDIAPHTNESPVAANIEREVSHVLDTMIGAFRGLMDNLLQNTAVDMQAEISALETVLAQEGLTEDGLSLSLPGDP